jgi:hypothetical protein
MMHLVGFEAMDLLYPPESTNARALAATGGVNAWSCLLSDEADLMFCRGLGDAIKLGSVCPTGHPLELGQEASRVIGNLSLE